MRPGPKNSPFKGEWNNSVSTLNGEDHMVRNHVIHINTRFGMNTTCQELFDILATYASEEDQAWVRKAYDYSASALAGRLCATAPLVLTGL